MNGMVAGLKTFKDQSYVVKDDKILYKVGDTFADVSYSYNTVYAYL